MDTDRAFRKTCLLIVLFASTVFTATADSQQANFRLSSLITDHMVLQQRSDVPLGGWGVPGQEVRVQASWGGKAIGRVKADSTWVVKLRTPEAGGPFQIVFQHDDTTLTVADVLIGEVWLCSGQSNMEMPLEGWPPTDTVQDAASVIEQSASAGIRYFSVRRAFSPVPEPVCEGGWVESSPSTSRTFSATAYFFGKKLHDVLGVPVGLIHSSWGGTAAESWISAQFLARVPQYDTTLQLLRVCSDARKRVMEWLHRYPSIDMHARKGEDRWKGLSFGDDSCSTRSCVDTAWASMLLPRLWESTDVGNFDGVVWFRKQVVIPEAWVHRDLTLELGPVDDIDLTFVNGVTVGGHEQEGMWKVDRTYRIPADLVDSTVIQISVRVIDYQGGGGIFGEPGSMKLHPEGNDEPVSLAGEWKYLPVALYLDNVIYVFGLQGDQYNTRPRLPIDLSAGTPTALYNGMISPLVRYAIKGVIWYQGESDTKQPKRYRTLFPLLIENWRSSFYAAAMPFYYVQIAPFDYGSATQSQYLREAQTATLAVKNTGMAVTLDIGNAKNIHPANKRDVGARLAAWALARTYGKKVPYSGPLLRSVRKQKRGIELVFDHAGKGLLVKDGPEGNEFQIAGSDRVFKDALVRVSGNRLIVSHPAITSPQSVRYAFSNTPVATLFNREGLPAPSFRTDDWE